jgi:20S proteasome alpha/beta subunit
MNRRLIAIEIVISLFLRVVASSNVLSPGEVSMGTTILAVRFKGGVVVGADT